MVDFAEERGVVTALLEVLRQRQDVRLQFSERNVIVEQPGGFRTSSRHQTGSRWPTDRLLTVGAIEKQTAFRDAVEVRSDGNR